MGIIGKNFKYKLINNFLNKDEIKICLNYFKIKHCNNFGDKIKFDIHTFATSEYADHLTEALLISKKNKMEEITGKKLLPTYSYWRMYTHLDKLAKHSDRESCEISVSVNFGSSGESWPLYMDDIPLETKPGDALVYLGRDVNHYRKKFMGDWYCQAFLHYVDANGPFAEFKLDKRANFGRAWNSEAYK